jgi:hypothetical protein
MILHLICLPANQGSQPFETVIERELASIRVASDCYLVNSSCAFFDDGPHALVRGEKDRRECQEQKRAADVEGVTTGVMLD